MMRGALQMIYTVQYVAETGLKSKPAVGGHAKYLYNATRSAR